MKASLTLLALLSGLAQSAHAFCGFYVAKADTSLFNQASKVVIVRDGERTVLTMANDFQGDVDDFAVVIPVPTFISEQQINVAERGLIEHLDAYTAPRLVEYHDPDPCIRYEVMSKMSADMAFPQSARDLEESRDRELRMRRSEVGIQTQRPLEMPDRLSQ